ncbi:MAG: class I mannose-6-phosphate isomerase [Acidobacteriota bacterium]|nr:class I mannose-6-phosphate isomerase [Acidobacteriota bacterium]
MDRPIRLLPIFRERVWGRESLQPYFPGQNRSGDPPTQRIGEVWFTFKENETSAGLSLGELIENEPGILGSAANPAHPGICPLLVKLLFTTERLSVQVHPDDEYAHLHHQSLGKTEAWYVMEAEPPAEVAVGFRQPISPEKLKEAAQTGEIEQLLDWRRVQPGDVIYTPAGTVHAIGAGLTICEIQENSDITYRLYDYGRPRELHLEHGVAVSHLGPHDHSQEVVKLASWRDQLAESSYFRIERLRPINAVQIDRGLPHYLLLICLKGSGLIAGKAFQAGQCWMVPAGGASVEISGPDSEWILTYTADQPIAALHGE